MDYSIRSKPSRVGALGSLKTQLYPQNIKLFSKFGESCMEPFQENVGMTWVEDERWAKADGLRSASATLNACVNQYSKTQLYGENCWF